MSNNKCGRGAEDRHIREATRWLAKLQDPNVSPRVLMRWGKWQESAANREAFDSVESLWRVINSSADAVDSAAPPSKTRSFDDWLERGRRVSEEAAYWYFVCVDRPSMLRSDRREFLAWMRRSPENIEELFKIAQLDGELRRLKVAMRSLWLAEWNGVEPTTSGSPYRLHRDIEEHDDIGSKDSVKHKRAFSFKAIFAAVLLIGAAFAFMAQEYMEPGEVVTTGASQWHHMTLPEGTAVHVDARSRVEVEYTDEARIVHVKEGSAVFDVAKDPKRPFIARTHLVDVTAVGTRFGVSIDSGVTTTVSEGVVRVTDHRKVDGAPVTLRADEELRVSNGSLTLPHIAQVDAERRLQWAKGLLVLSGLTVAQGVDELNRRNRVQIVVESPVLASRVVEFARVNVNAPERYASIVAAEPGVRMIVDKKKGVIRLSE